MEIFGTGFGQSWTGLRFGFDRRTNVFGFCGVFWYHSNLVMNREGTKRCLVLYGSEIWAILCVLLEKKCVVVCKNHVNMCLSDVLTWKL